MREDSKNYPHANSLLQPIPFREWVESILIFITLTGFLAGALALLWGGF